MSKQWLSWCAQWVQTPPHITDVTTSSLPALFSSTLSPPSPWSLWISLPFLFQCFASVILSERFLSPLEYRLQKLTWTQEHEMHQSPRDTGPICHFKLSTYVSESLYWLLAWLFALPGVGAMCGIFSVIFFAARLVVSDFTYYFRHPQWFLQALHFRFRVFHHYIASFFFSLGLKHNSAFIGDHDQAESGWQVWSSALMQQSFNLVVHCRNRMRTFWSQFRVYCY